MNKDILKEIHNHILKIASMERAETSKWFFKTGKGEYGEGDKFLGLTVPQTRQLSRVYSDLSLSDIEKLLQSTFHDERLLALIILTNQSEKTKDPKIQKQIFNLYLRNIKTKINNWDLVDTSAPKIVGAYLAKNKTEKEIKEILTKLAKSKNLWENRVAIISTLYFIMKEKEYKYTFPIIKILMSHKHDLIHKANGWMMREIYKRLDGKVVREFLKENYNRLPRTTLRYTIEKMNDLERKSWLRGEM